MSVPRFDMIGFDADDTLWQNEQIFIAAQLTLKEILSHYHQPEWIEERLYATEMRNLQHFGYGVKSFALSMIETAVELSEGRISGHEIQTIIDATKAMLAAEIELITHVPEVLEQLSASYRLVVITKGDLYDQEAKIVRSGLADYFQHIEIVSNKRPANYARLLDRYAVAPERFLMVGNSLRSDILPVLELGGSAVYVPHELTWAHEHAEAPQGQAGFYEIAHIGLLPELLRSLS